MGPRRSLAAPVGRLIEAENEPVRGSTPALTLLMKL